MKFAYPSGTKPLDGYTLKRGIGIGGFGEVYFALSDAGKEVALKRIQRNLDVELRGVRQCLNLKHVNLISLWDIKTNDAGESWVVMEYVPGQSLRDIVEDHPNGMPEDQVKDWFVSTSAGVAYLHDHGIVHRDLKPGNIFYDSDQEVIKIGDYGLSKFISCSRRSGQTESVGTFHYMAPEIGKGVYGKEIDIYALGIILFEMLTGRVPFEGESSQEIIMKHLTADPDVDRVPYSFREVIHRCLVKDPEQRFSNVAEMLGHLPWPDIAAKGQEVARRNSVGPIGVSQRADENAVEAQLVHRNSRRSTVVEGDKPQPSAHQASARPVSPPPPQKPKVAPGSILFGDVREQGIELGDVRTSSPGPGAYSPSQANRHASNPRPSVRVSNIADRVEVAHADRRSMNPEAVASEPIAKALQTGVAGVGAWWTNPNVSLPVKIVVLIVATIVVITNSGWLLPVTLGVGLVYLIYYAIRDWVVNSEDEKTEDPSLASTHARPARSLMVSAEERKSAVRDWLASRDLSDRAVELLGSLIIATIASVVFNLVGVAIGGSLFNASIDNWAEFTWKTLTCVSASWLVLLAGKFWEQREGNGWLRRSITALLGGGVGVVAFFTAQTLHVPVDSLTEATRNPNFPTAMQLEGLSQLTALVLFFATMFYVLGWWKQSDPTRRTRLSIWSVGACLAWAGILSHVLNIAPLATCVMVVVISISVQLAAPWLHPQDREHMAASG